MTIQTNHSGRSFTVEGTGCSPGGYVTPTTLDWTPGASCTIAFVSPHSLQVGTRYLFTGWQDGATANPRVIVAPAQAATFTATFDAQYQLDLRVNPFGAGIVSGGGWFYPGTTTTIAAAPSDGYHFERWEGSSVGNSTTASMQVTLFGPTTITAVFGTVTSGPPTAYNVVQIANNQTANGPRVLNARGQVAMTNGVWDPVAPNTPAGSLVTIESPGFYWASINDSGQMVAPASPIGSVFLWSPAVPNGTSGTTTKLVMSSPVFESIGLPSINSFGQIGYGSSLWTPSVPRGTTGTVVVIAPEAKVVGINDFGQAIANSPNGGLPVLFTPVAANASAGSLTSVVGSPGGDRHSVVAINNSGDVVGVTCSIQPSGSCVDRVFLWRSDPLLSSNGVVTEIPAPSGVVGMTPTAMNNKGEVVGYMRLATGGMAGFLYTRGAVYDLSVADPIFATALPVGINDAGQIVLMPFGLIVEGGRVYLANPIQQSQPLSVNVTITAAPGPATFTADGTSYTTPHTFEWSVGSVHEIAFASTMGSGDTRQRFTKWVDGPITESRQITVPNTPASYGAQYVTQHRLALLASPLAGGHITITPTSPDGYYDASSTLLISGTPAANYRFTDFSGVLTGTANPQQLTLSAPATLTASFALGAPQSGEALRFVPLPPCRLTDTRLPEGSAPLAGGSTNSFAVAEQCGVPATARAYALNLTAVPQGPLSYVTLWPSGSARPLASTLNSFDGRVKANAAIVPAGVNGNVSVFVTQSTHVVLDITGYFVPATDATALAFYPLPPCRLADTREPESPLASTPFAPGESRTLPVLANGCGVPAEARAYSLNFTVAPKGPLGYLTTWPTGEARPNVSTLNAHGGQITANAAIVPAGNGGGIDVLAMGETDVVVDINGYFAPPGPGGLALYTQTPCRVMDTRVPLAAPVLMGARDFNPAATACGVPGGVGAYVLNATVLPAGGLGYLTLWPQGGTLPYVSTLNAGDGAVTSNMAIVPAAESAISAFASNPAELILDVLGYFAP